ncbi:MAG: hypothetical protein SFV81_29150 [Pirellulaceae bacterium]|nr:hypothetical protein [Pirellulaceae bacterium]
MQWNKIHDSGMVVVFNVKLQLNRFSSYDLVTIAIYYYSRRRARMILCISCLVEVGGSFIDIDSLQPMPSSSKQLRQLPIANCR